MGSIPGSGRSRRRNWQLTQARAVSWTEEPGRLQSMGSQRVGHNLATPHHTHTHTHAYDCCSVTKSPLTLCDPVDHSLSASSVHGILQARILEWVAISISRGASQPRDRTWVSSIASDLLFHCGLIYQLSYQGSPVCVCVCVCVCACTNLSSSIFEDMACNDGTSGTRLTPFEK